MSCSLPRGYPRDEAGRGLGGRGSWDRDLPSAGRGHAQAFDDAKSAVRLLTRPGRLASGVPSSVPAYELRDPFAPPDVSRPNGREADAQPAPAFTPQPVAAGVPILIGGAEPEAALPGEHDHDHV